MSHKSGFVNIIGNPNVGKSTLMNALVGERLSIITSKAQTTRHRIMGIVNGEDFQIVYSDTPGILKPHYKMHKNMMHFVNEALVDADVILYVTDVYETSEKNEEYIHRVTETNVPVILVINKVDLSNQEKLEELNTRWRVLIPNAQIIPTSALEGFNLNVLFDRVMELLPEGPAYYDKDALTDKSERFFAAEIIREKIFLNYQKEIPYSTDVIIESFKDEPEILRLSATIFVERDTQKGILIGHKGSALKKTATAARFELEKFFAKKVFLEVFVKVSKDWRDNDRQLRSLGFHPGE